MVAASASERSLTSSLTADQLSKLARLNNDFEYFARACLKVRSKSGQVLPFVLNRAQVRLHEKLQEQERRTGKVRAVIVKGRQMGASTYIQGRFFWKMWRKQGRGLKAFILTHEQPATDNLFKITKRFQDQMPAGLGHGTVAANAKELAFAGRDSSYLVATAGSKGVGRSDTLQLFHGSEVAFWPNAEDHIDGVEQAIADTAGTEKILESTANGVGNVFQRRYSAAERGQSDEESIFLPWFWDAGYEEEPPADWDAPYKWLEYQAQHRISDAQLYWAFKKNRGMATAISESSDEPCWKFKQEYPASANEAFQSSGNSFIPSVKVQRARRTPDQPQIIGLGHLIIGVDPGRGGDPTGVIYRRGRRMGQLVHERWDDADTMVVAGKVVRLIKLLRPDLVNVDVGGIGAGVYDRLRELGYGHIVNPVNFGSSPVGVGPTGDELYANRRAEMWDVYRAWYDDPAGVQVPDDDAFQADATAPVWGTSATRYRSNNELILEDKDKIRARLGFSPDVGGDAAALTFAVPLAPHRYDEDDDIDNRGRNASTGY
jgi:hypothetical protein